MATGESCDVDDQEYFDQAREQALDDALETCDDADRFGFRSYVAECTDSDLVVIVRLYSLGSTANFYEEENGSFAAWREWSDAIDETCSGKTYCPIVVDCDDAIVTEVICEGFRNVGDTVHLLDSP